MARSNRKRRPAKLIPSLVLVALVAAAVLAAVALCWYRPALRPVDSTRTATQLVHIERGMSSSDIVHLLANKGLVRDARAALICATLSGAKGKLKAGYYDLSPALSTPEILETIASGKVAQRRVVVVPGLRLSQIAQRVAAAGLAGPDDFMAHTRASEYLSAVGVPLPPKGTVEGYLFPATYTFAVGTSAPEIIRRMIEAFGSHFYKPHRAEIAASGHTLREIVIVASLVEREAARDEERPLIAGVLYNRLARGMKLQCDATVQYALKKHKPRLLYKDLRVPSPYNTYLHAGLPPGPICSPGLASLMAALRPAKHDYLFYVARGGGYHQFTRTYQEHLRAIERIRGGQRGQYR